MLVICFNLYAIVPCNLSFTFSSYFDNMSSFNDALKNIKIKNLAIIIIVAYLGIFLLSQFSGPISFSWVYVIVIFYFIFMLKDYFNGFKQDVRDAFSKSQLRYVLLIVFLNIFFSYGMLYLANGIIIQFPFLDFLVNFSIPSMSLVGYFPIAGSFISTVVISPISEEFIFRGVFLNRLKLFVPTVFAIVITSLLFGSLHNFGSLISAFVFAVCMAILYLKTDNICVPILAHFLNNLFAEIIRSADVNELLFTNGWVIGIVSILAIVSAILLFTSILNELNKIK